MSPESERRAEDRRQAERRQAPRGGPDRRQGERRGAGAARTGVLLAALSLFGGVAGSEAQIYTRVKDGVVEATNIPGGDGFRLTYIGKGTLIHSRGFVRRSNNSQFNHYIETAAALHGVNVDLVRAVIQVESEFDYLARSSKGAQGLMQLMPDTARRFGVSNSFDPQQNIFGGVKYLRFLLDMFQGDTALATAAYNAGENAVLRYKGVPPYKETRGYVQKIQALLGAVASGVQAAFNTPAAFYTPGQSSAVRVVSAARSSARPRLLFKWRDEKGLIHVAQSPPPAGVVYTVVRALD